MSPIDPDAPISDPIPGAESLLGSFYRGVIVRLNRGRGDGLVRTGNGREVRFVKAHVELLDGRRFDDLANGAVVGFDVGWTSKGLRVTRLKLA